MSQEEKSLKIDQNKPPETLERAEGIEAENHLQEEPLEQSVADTPTKEEILRMAPKEMVDFLTSLDEDVLTQFLTKATEDPELLAQVSYWQKWLRKDQRRIFDRLIEAKKECYPGNSESLPLELEKKFSPEELRLILSNTGVIQLTFGCSYGCAFCGLDAIKGVREHIPYAQLANLFQQYGGELNTGKPFLYWASEPSDYASTEGLEDRTYADVHQLATTYAHYDPDITTINAKDEAWIDFMTAPTVVTKNNGQRRFSMYGMSGQRDEFPAEKLQNTARDIQLLGISTRTGLQTQEHNIGIGLSTTKYDETKFGQQAKLKVGIACKDGILITPRGIYNMITIPITERYPQGQIIVPLRELTDQDIQIGDHVESIMQHAVIHAFHSHDTRHEHGNAWRVTVHTKKRRFVVFFDTNGMVTQLNQLPNIPEKSTFDNLTIPSSEEIETTLGEIELYYKAKEGDRIEQRKKEGLDTDMFTSLEMMIYKIVRLYTLKSSTSSNTFRVLLKKYIEEVIDTVLQNYNFKRAKKYDELLGYSENVLSYLRRLELNNEKP